MTVRFLAILVLAQLAAMAQSQPASPAEKLISEPRPLVIGHRGYSAAAPENTMAAFEFALLAGADLVELDYYHSSDGIPVVIHDTTLDRTTNGDELWKATKIPVGSKSAAELTSLDSGSWFSPRFASEKVPTLEASLDFIQAKGVTLIERKAGDPATCVEMLRRKNLVNKLVVQAFDWEYLKGFHKIEPRQVLGALGPPSTVKSKKLSDEEKALTPAWIDQVLETGSKIVVWNRQVTASAVEYAHQKGLKVWVYTINDPALAGQLLDLKIDGIITDNVGLIWRAVALHSRK